MTEADWLAIGETCRQAALEGVRLCPPTHVGYGIGGHAKTCGSPGKSPWHPWKQYQAELADAEQVVEWWRQRPMSNVGLVLGEISGLIGIDIDGEIADGQWRAPAAVVEGYFSRCPKGWRSGRSPTKRARRMESLGSCATAPKR